MAVREDELWEGVFMAKPEHEPKSNEEKYARLNFYLYHSTLKIVELLQSSIREIRSQASSQPNPELQRMALKPCKPEELEAAVKEVLCLWQHLEALAQGGEAISDWVRNFLLLALSAADYEIPKPKSMQVLDAYNHCEDHSMFRSQASVRICKALGYGGSAADAFARNVRPIIASTDTLRQRIFEEALSRPVTRLSLQAP